MNDNYYDVTINSKRTVLPSRQQQQAFPNLLSSTPTSSAVSIHSNGSVGSLALSSSISLNTKKSGPRKLGSHVSLPTLNEGKRPGDYYVQKLTHLSPAPVLKCSHLSDSRPVSGDSLCSENSLILSSHFEIPESRFSSITANSLINPSPLESIKSPEDSPSITNFSFNDELPEMSFEADDYLNTSGSTLILKNSLETQIPFAKHYTQSASNVSRSFQSTSNLNYSQGSLPRPVLRSASTSQMKPFAGLKRTKSRYLSSKESKERQQMRKKKYDDFDDDDDVLLDDMDSLVFNVPVIKNSELYINTGGFHNDLMTTAMKTLQKTLPVSSSSLVILLSSSIPKLSDEGKFSLAEDTILEEPEQQPEPVQLKDLNHEHNDDRKISESITNFYSQRSTSVSKLMKLSREQQMIYRLPNYVKSQTSMEDLNLVSLEKLSMIDQSRPINLPPKTVNDKSKHNKEFKKVLTNYELNTKSILDTRKKSNQNHMVNHQTWIKTIENVLADSAKDFNKNFNYDKNNIRKLAWEANIPSSHRFEFLMKILRSNSGDDNTLQGRHSFDSLNANYSNLSKSIKANKDVEFNRVIDLVLQRPLFESILMELTEYGTFSALKFHENFKYLLYIKSLSEQGLRKHDEIFLIPALLLLFQNTQPLKEIYNLVELMNQQVLTSGFLDVFNAGLSNWNDVNNSYSVSNYLYKFMQKSDVSEFDNLNSNIVFEMLVQINDKLPLSLSAPTTPILSQSPFNFSSGSLGNILMSPLQNGATSSASLQTASGTGSAASVSGSVSDLSMTLTPHTSHTSVDDASYVDANSSSLQLVLRLVQLLVVYSNSPKLKNKNNLKVIQTFLMSTIKNYHLNWNNLSDLIKNNKSIRLNNSGDQVANLDSFVDKWKDVFKRW